MAHDWSTVSSLLRSVAGVVPDTVLSRLVPAGLRWDDSSMRIARATATTTRVAIGPANSAGQGYAWARAIERSLADASAVCYMTVTPASAHFAFDADVAVPLNGYAFAAGWQRGQRDALSEFTHLLLESGRHPFGPQPWRTPLDEVRTLHEHGVATAMVWHGSDIRLPSAHAATEPESPFGLRGSYPRESVAILERNALRHLRMIESTDIPVFVSTPGLLYVPRARWLPVVVNPSRWTAPPAFERDVPVVAYAPSNSAMKGDPSIDAQLTSLEEEGIISYVRVERVPSAQMPEVYAGADIILDQFKLGDYGVAACEAMAAGRVVVGHVSDVVRHRVRAETGIELPIVESTSGDVGAVVRRLVSDRDGARRAGERGTAYVGAVHDGARSVRALEDFLGRADRSGA